MPTPEENLQSARTFAEEVIGNKNLKLRTTGSLTISSLSSTAPGSPSTIPVPLTRPPQEGTSRPKGRSTTGKRSGGGWESPAGGG
jgi:hypothetical protein